MTTKRRASGRGSSNTAPPPIPLPSGNTFTAGGSLQDAVEALRLVNEAHAKNGPPRAHLPRQPPRRAPGEPPPPRRYEMVRPRGSRGPFRPVRVVG
jgi:hypothetical protein